MKRIYDRNSKIDFGMYRGYVLGIVYVFDPSYIDWCINNINGFHISDLDKLKDFGVINENIDWHYRLIGDPELIPGIDTFDTFKKLTESTLLGDKKYIFSEKSLIKNKENSNYINQDLKDNNHTYDESSYHKYGEYNGYDDDTIDSAFDGDPTNTWNVD
jgi:hypothetical protein